MGGYDDDGYKLFVGGLPKGIRWEDLNTVFSNYGEVEKIHIMPPQAETGLVAAFVFYRSLSSAENAIEVLNDKYKIRRDAEHPIQVRWPMRKRVQDGDSLGRRLLANIQAGKGGDSWGGGGGRDYNSWGGKGERSAWEEPGYGRRQDYGYDKGYDKGWGKGYDKGYDKGYGKSYDKGYKGYDKGYDKGYGKSYDKGYKGYDKGYGNNYRTEATWGGDQGGWDPLVADAINEIKRQLHEQGGHGYVWVDEWWEKYRDLGSLREFMESRPDKFTMYYGDGKKFTVGLAGHKGGKGKGKGKAVEAPKGKSGPTDIKPKAKAKVKVKAKDSSKENDMKTPKEKAEKWRVKGEDADDDSLVGSDTKDGLAEKAEKEIRKQLNNPNNEGFVWIKNWNRQYKDSLGTLREYLESQPEKFTVTPGEGAKFTVSVA